MISAVAPMGNSVRPSKLLLNAAIGKSTLISLLRVIEYRRSWVLYRSKTKKVEFFYSGSLSVGWEYRDSHGAHEC